MSIDKKKAIEFLCTVTHKSQLLNVLQASELLVIEDTQLIPKIPLETNIIYGHMAKVQERKAKHREIEALRKVQLFDKEDDLVDKNDIFLSSKEQNEVTRWREVNTPILNKKIKVFEFQLAPGFPAKKIYTDAPTHTEPSSKTLKWVASTYRALVKKESNDKERIPAWCNIAMSNLIEDGETENTVCVLSPAKDTINTPLPFAFIRDGKRGLRAHEIYKKQGYLWRAGIALTDLLGFTQELDKYAEIKVDKSLNSPIEQVLKSSLRKLNGSVYWAHKVGEFDNQDSIPPRIERTLQFLSNFPDEKRSENQSAFALLSELESSLMRERMTTYFSPENSGELPSLYSRGLKTALLKVPISWFESFNNKLTTTSEDRKEPAFWSSLFSLFESDLFDTENTFERERGSALLGCIYNYTDSFLKGVVFEQEAINRIGDTNYDELDLAGIIGFEETTLVLGEQLNDISSLVEYFKNLIELNTPQTKFNKITTAGWLVLALIKIKFIVTDNRVYSEKFKKIGEALGGSSILVKLLTKSSANPREFWPIEHEPQAPSGSPLNLDDKNALVDTFSQIKAFLKLLDPIYSEQSKVRLVDVESKHFNYNSSKNKYLERWEINKWQVNIAGGDKPSTKSVNGELLSDWVETTTEGSRPIYVSLLSARYGLIENTFSFDKANSSSELVSEEQSNLPVDSPQQNIPLERAKNNNDERKEPLVDNKEQESTKSNVNDGFNFNRSSFYGSQVEGWNRRGNTKSPSHIRAAFLQLRLNDKLGCGYEFPNFDEKEKDDKGAYEKEERRRQAILNKVLETCKQLNVEYLVLPEYSVQQDTIIWLKSKLKNSKISILAGTYRYSPNTYPDREYELKKGCLGTKNPIDLKGCEAVLTLLVPHSNDVIILNRTKKYASPASNELINPSRETLIPLFTFESFLGEVKARDEALKKVKNSLKKLALLNEVEDVLEDLSLIHDYVDSKVVLKLDELKKLWNEGHIRPLNFIQELICAELFLLTNPTNHNDLNSERVKLGNHFGTPITEDNVIKATLADLQNISDYLTRQGEDKDPYRRSIISIPAMTTRTEDYWLFGQSAMLANGFSTIFCNAVSNGHGKGGSCFIGLDSWLENKSSNDFITPYHGWCKGIYYGNSSEALEEESALVIADIDPLMMSQGKPRPQATPVPMRLVGYLPIIEYKSENENLLKEVEHALDNLVNLKGTISTLSNKDLSLEDCNELKKAVESFLFTDPHSEKATKGRIEHWKESINKHPMSGLPGALTDWIAVEVEDE
ncbi:hypothetical protein Q4540_16410 [Pseudoalteromonas carrageenovora]|uniref:hypothetical protein n=1 Tax=Pseudoalteromonas carrageenovora TaxID=227 RepID=UPI0026E2611E|nr:hypothetical protein [Pseudoalteromonas carrageenovora]MDO6637824.1 hypothetical protein [Pseudoalteromonas carrageenovora]MDO6650080.1 hypothetical protein [Pseudoalteromonas carrageenovora]